MATGEPVLKGNDYSVEIPSWQEIPYLWYVRARHALPDASFVWLPIRECFLIGDCFILCSRHFVNISVNVWVRCQPEVLLLSRWQGLDCSVLPSGEEKVGGRQGGSNHSVLFSLIFLSFFF